MFEERDDISTEELKRLRARGMTYQAIADKVGMSLNGVHRRIGPSSDRPSGGSFCRVCHAETEVIETRDTEYKGIRALRRRRECVECGQRHTTYEIDSEDLVSIFADRELLMQWAEVVQRLMDKTPILSRSRDQKGRISHPDRG